MTLFATWPRRLGAERDAEPWQREKRDVVEVPGPISRGEGILKQLDSLPQAQKAQFLEELAAAPKEEKRSMKQRGSHTRLNGASGVWAHTRSRKTSTGLGSPDTEKIERINKVARIVDRAHRAELSRTNELTRGLKTGFGLGM